MLHPPPPLRSAHFTPLGNANLGFHGKDLQSKIFRFFQFTTLLAAITSVLSSFYDSKRGIGILQDFLRLTKGMVFYRPLLAEDTVHDLNFEFFLFEHSTYPLNLTRECPAHRWSPHPVAYSCPQTNQLCGHYLNIFIILIVNLLYVFGYLHSVFASYNISQLS